MSQPRTASNVPPGSNGMPGEGITATPAPLYELDPVTFTPAPSLTTSTALPTLTQPPTQSSLHNFATATLFRLPTATSLPATSGASLTISGVDKVREFVDIQNIGNGAVYLNGWILVSERGEQACELSGILQTKEVLRIWAGRGEVGFSCGFLRTIWTDNEPDPAVLYNPQGEEVSRFP